MDNIFDKLRKDHNVQRDMFEMLLDTVGDTVDRRTLFGELKRELQDHAKYEERHFYKPLLSSNITQSKTRHSISEHHDIDEKIEDLEKTEFGSSSWLQKAKDLRDCVIHHLDEEEQEMFQIAGRELSSNQKMTISRKYAGDMQETREAR